MTTFLKRIEAQISEFESEINAILKEGECEEAGGIVMRELVPLHEKLRTALWNGPSNQAEAKRLMRRISIFAATTFPDAPYILGPERLKAERIDIKMTAEESKDFFQDLAVHGDPEEAVRAVKRGRGRPLKPKEECMICVKLTIRPEQRERLDSLGGSEWLRAQIDKAR